MHGGDVYRNEVRLDFSVNLNPLGVPASVRQAAQSGLDEMQQYPDPYQSDLRRAVAEYENTSPDRIICGNGASELIMASVHAVIPRRALVVSPCYSGYETALAAAGTEITEYLLDEACGFRLDEGFIDLITEDIDMVFIADPNNPNGRLTDLPLLGRIAERCAECGAVLMIDECFLPLTGSDRSRRFMRGDAAGGLCKSAGTVLHLRAFTKTASIPGIRLGYLITDDEDMRGRIMLHLPEWNVSRIAEKAGAAAADLLAHTDFIDRSVSLIRTEREYLAHGLSSMGIKVYPSDVNYLLIRSDTGLYDRLLEQGILIRRCADFRGLDETFYRIAVRSHEDNEALINTLREVCRQEENTL